MVSVLVELLVGVPGIAGHHSQLVLGDAAGGVQLGVVTTTPLLLLTLKSMRGMPTCMR